MAIVIPYLMINLRILRAARPVPQGRKAVN